MAETIQRKLNDSSAARWTALLLIASTMFFGYMFVDLMSPLQSMIEAQRGWTPDVFGMYGSSEFILNVFGFLILAGIILDKMGVRFTGQLSASLMFIGALSEILRRERLVRGFGHRNVARLVVDLVPRLGQTGVAGLYDLRLRHGDGRHHRIKSHSQVVRRQGDGSGHGT